MQIEHNRIQKNSNWLKAAPVGYLSTRSRIWTQDDRGQIQQAARAGIEPGTAGLRVRRADNSATLPPKEFVVACLRPP